MVRRNLQNVARQFYKDKDGSTTVEFVLWMPVFILVLTLIVDASLLFSTQSKMLRVATDATRNIAMDVITADQAQDYVDTHGFGDSDYVIAVNQTGDVISTELTVPIGKAAATNLFALVATTNVKVKVSQRLEPKFLE